MAKTLRSRIAAVAVAALGVGLLQAAPASAAASATTVAFTIGTSPTTVPVVGSPVVIPINATVAGTQANAATAILEATITTRPTALTALTAYSTSLDISTYDAAHTAANNTGEVTAATTSAGAKLTMTLSAVDADNSSGEVGRFSFTPDVAGYYVITFTDTGTSTTTFTNDTIGVVVYGGTIVQAGSGVGSSTGTQVTSRQAAATFQLPAGTQTTDRFKVSATGANIVGVYDGGTLVNAADASTYTTSAGVTKNNGTDYAAGATITPQRAVTAPTVPASSSTSEGLIVTFTSATAGSATVSLKKVNQSTGVETSYGSVTVEFGAVPTVSASLSTSYIGQGNACATTQTTAPIRVPKTAGVTLSSTSTSGATICINIKDTAGSALVAQAVSVSVSGPGLITLASGNGTGSTGTVRTASLTAATMASSSSAVVGISGDGTAGVGTITITAGGVTISTKTVNFYGSVASLTATQNLKIARSGRTATSSATFGVLGSATNSDDSSTVAKTPAVVIVAKDADGNVVPGVTVTAVIGDANVIGAVNITEQDGTALTNGASGAGYFISNVQSAIGGVSGASTTVTYRTPNPAAPTTYLTTAPLTFTLGGTKTGGTVTMTLDKATYAPGEKMKITIIAKDASGKPVYDGTTTGTLGANKNVLGLANDVFYDGEYILGDDENVYAPATSGAFTVTLATGTATGAEISVTANVSADAATAAADAAKAEAAKASAAVAALATTVANMQTAIASLVASVTATLTAMSAQINKIMKKLKIK